MVLLSCLVGWERNKYKHSFLKSRRVSVNSDSQSQLTYGRIKDATYITRIAEILGQPYGDFAEELAKAKAAEE